MIGDAEFAEALRSLALQARETDPSAADQIQAAAALGRAAAEEGVAAIVEGWEAQLKAEAPHRNYLQFLRKATVAVEDGVERLAVETERALVAFSETISSLEKTPAQYHDEMVTIRDAKRAEVFGTIVAEVEAEGAKRGIRVPHAGLLRALERAVPNPDFTVDYTQSGKGDPGEAAVAGALLGTAMMPVIGTAIGGVAGWFGSHLLGEKGTPAQNLERQKAWIVQAASIVRSWIEDAQSDAADVVGEKVPSTAPEILSSDVVEGLEALVQAAKPLVAQGAG